MELFTRHRREIGRRGVLPLYAWLCTATSEESAGGKLRYRQALRRQRVTNAFFEDPFEPRVVTPHGGDVACSHSSSDTGSQLI